MTPEQLKRLEQIYNTFLLVETKGENTIIMGQTLRALKMFIEQCAAGPPSPHTITEREEKE